MNTKICPDSEVLAQFATGESSPEEWRRVVQHLSDCSLCRRQAALVAEEIPIELAQGSEAPFARRPRRDRSWPRVVGNAAAAATFGFFVWALAEGPSKPSTPEPPQPVVRTLPKQPLIPPAAPRRPEAILPDTPVQPPPLPGPLWKDLSPVAAPSPAPIPAPPAPEPPSPFLVERTRSFISEAIEVVPAQGFLSRLSAGGSERLDAKAWVQPSDSLTSSAGGALLLPDGSTLHLAPEAQVRVSWSQSLACMTVDVRSGDAVVDLGKTPKPLLVSHQATGVQLQKSMGKVFVSAGGGSLRATLLSGVAEVKTPAGGLRILAPHETLVLRESGDSLESVEKADVSHFPTLEPAARALPGGVAPRPKAEPKAPALDPLASSLAAQSYSYKVTGRDVREGVWSPAGIYTSTIETITAARRADENDHCHFQRGTRPWDDLGKIGSGSREAHLLDVLRGLKAPHLMVQEWAAQVTETKAPRPEKVRDRLCLVWNLTYSPESLRKPMESAIDAAVGDGRLQKPDYVYWETVEGEMEASALKYESRLMKVVDRRKVSYSYKTVAGLDRRIFQLETTIDFYSHGVATFPLPNDLLKRLNLVR